MTGSPVTKDWVKRIPQMDYEVIDGIARAIIYRVSDLAQTEPCPFCGCSHFHALDNDGLHKTNCIPIWKKGNGGILQQPKDIVFAKNSVPLFRLNGYVLKTDTSIKSIFSELENRQV